MEHTVSQQPVGNFLKKLRFILIEAFYVHQYNFYLNILIISMLGRIKVNVRRMLNNIFRQKVDNSSECSQNVLS